MLGRVRLSVAARYWWAPAHSSIAPWIAWLHATEHDNYQEQKHGYRNLSSFVRLSPITRTCCGRT